jgi:hypothetical protein
MLPSLLLVVGLSQFSAVACESRVKTDVNIIAESAPVSVASDFSLSHIATLAHRAPHSAVQPPPGFYISTVVHKVSMQLEPGPTHACAGDLRIDVSIELTGRQIEIGREMTEQSCRYSAILRHYQKKAAVDSAVFTKYLDVVKAALHAAPLPTLQIGTDEDLSAATRQRIEQWVKKVVDQHLQSYQVARLLAMQAVDTPDEMRQLSEACAQGV